jgi:hypothetical protein
MKKGSYQKADIVAHIHLHIHYVANFSVTSAVSFLEGLP